MSKNKEFQATHKVSFYGVRCYMDDNSFTLWGTNAFMELLIPVAAFWHDYFIAPFIEGEGFPVKVLEIYEKIEESEN